MDPAIDLATQAAADDAEWTLGTNMFHGPVLPVGVGVPVKAAFLMESGGVPPESQGGQTTSMRRTSVQVITRDVKDQIGTSRTSAKGLFDTINFMTISGYIDVRCRQSYPLFLGIDANGYPEWSINVELFYEE